MSLIILTKIMIRPIKLKDIDELIKIETSLFGESFGRDFVFNAMLKKNNANYYVCTRNRMIIGYVGFTYCKPEIEIFGIGVKREYQNMGCASYLLTWLFKKLAKKGYERAYLDVRVRNAAARHVYEKLGFVRVNRRKKFYGNDDSFTYVKHL